jgi:glycosyltransferase involved in cell wall biosynthesis
VRITIVQGPFLPVPPLLGGAVERSMQTLAQHWAAAGCSVTHISRRFPGLAEEESVAGVRHRRIPSSDAPANPLLFRLRELGYVRRAIRALPPADIVVANSVLMPIVLRSRRFGRVVPQLQRPPKGQLRFYRHVDLVQTISQDMRRRILAAAPWLEGRVSVVGSPLAGPLAPVAPGTALPEREALVTYVGRLHAEKGLELLLQAFLSAAPQVPGWRLQLIGPAEVNAGGSGEAYRRRLEGLAQRLPGLILLRPAIFEPAALAAELRRSAVFAYPSLAERGEALGLAPLEAAGQGAVPLVSALACFEDFVTDGVSGAVFDHRAADPVAALARRLGDLLRDRDGLRRLSAGAISAAATYAAPLVAERYLADFRRLIGATAAARS